MQISSVNSIGRHLDAASLRAVAGRPAAAQAPQAPQFAAINAVQVGRAHAAQPASFIAGGPRGTGTGEDQPGPLASLLADWGKSGSPWDLDGDGTVGIKDMLALLEKMGGGAQAPQTLPAPATQGAAGLQPATEPQIDQPDPLKALLADWGKSGSAWDLDADGTVGIKDMLALLQQMSGQAPQPLPVPLPLPNPQPAPTPHAEPADSIAELPDEPPDALTALKADWGKSGSAWDLNGDGTVNIQDMLALLERMSTKKVVASGVEPSVTATPAATTDAVETPAPPTDPAPPTRLESLLADWGKSGSSWDLNRDGTVNIRDLLTLLSQMSDRGTGVPGGNDPRLLNTKLVQRLHATFNVARQAEWAAVKRSLSVVG